METLTLKRKKVMIPLKTAKMIKLQVLWLNRRKLLKTITRKKKRRNKPIASKRQRKKRLVVRLTKTTVFYKMKLILRRQSMRNCNPCTDKTSRRCSR